MQRLIVILALIFAYTVCPAQQSVRADTSAVQVRQVSGASTREYRNDPKFQYDKVIEPNPSLWDRFWSWFWWKVEQLLKTRSGRNTFWSVLILIGLSVLAFFIYKVMKMNRAGLFMRAGNTALDFTVGHEDIHQIAFDEEISDAINEGKYRLAVRLLYLQSLKKLSDNNYIDWRINKTNLDYVREVAQKPWQTLFSQLTYQFEYVWYGETDIARERFDDLHQSFKQLHNLL
jgi:uncharacterized protein YaaQ